MKKKLMALLCAAAMTVSLAACGAETDTTYAGQTLTGRVTAMDGTAVTLALGELSEDAAPAGGASSDNDSQQPPEMPSGTPPEKPGGVSGDSQQSPEKPEGESGSQSDGGTPPEMPDGSTGGSSFTENGETLTVDIARAAITKDGESITASDVAVDDILTVTFDDSGNSSAAIRSDRGGGTWTLTGDCVITSLTNNGTINFNGYTITLADGTVLQ